MKTCKICKKAKENEEFYKTPNYADGRRGECIKCLREKIGLEKANKKKKTEFFQHW